MNLNNFYITIDTEPDCDIRWHRSSPLTFTSVTYGIPKLLRPIWDKYDINPIYFVSPEVANNDQCCRVLKEEIEQGAIIGAHLHSEYVAPNITIKNIPGSLSSEFPCYAHSDEIEFQKIKNFTNIIRDRLGIRPIWYRAGRYGADINTIKSLSKLGYKYDSSVTPGISWKDKGGPDYTKAPEQPYYISKDNFYRKAPSPVESIGIIEVPITISGKRFGFLRSFFPDNWLFYRWLRPTHMTVFEQKLLIREFIKKYKNPVLVMMFHSMEIVPKKSPFVRNKLMQTLFLRRIEDTIKYITFFYYEKL